MELNIEEGVATFSINEIGDVSKQSYMGTFKVHCILSPIHFIDADKDYRNLLGAISPESAHQHARTSAFALSQLKYRIIDMPPFWENNRMGGSHIKDDNILIAVLNLALEAEKQYRDQRQKDAEEIQERLKNMYQKHNKGVENDS